MASNTLSPAIGFGGVDIKQSALPSLIYLGLVTAIAVARDNVGIVTCTIRRHQLKTLYVENCQSYGDFVQVPTQFKVYLGLWHHIQEKSRQ